MKKSKGNKGRSTGMSAQITIVDDSGTVQPPPDVEIDDGGTVFLQDRASKNATLHFSGDKVLFHHGVQVDQQAVKHGGSESLIGRGQNKTVHYQVRMARPGPGRPGNGTIKVGQTRQRKRPRNVVKSKKRTTEK
jgi:hypothetical protein